MAQHKVKHKTKHIRKEKQSLVRRKKRIRINKLDEKRISELKTYYKPIKNKISTKQTNINNVTN
jgi:hypothetical protein